MLLERIPPIIASRYRVVRPIGEGNMGQVFLVQQTQTGEQLALKVLQSHLKSNKKLVKRFKQEALLLRRIKSEHVVKVVDADLAPELDGAPFLVMELLQGCDLQDHVVRYGKLPVSDVVVIYWQLAEALNEAHQLGIVHRDLKPENIFLHVPSDGRTLAKILDFGVSKLVGDVLGSMDEAHLTGTGAVLGTPLYMPPEQVTGHASNIGPAADIWALGMMAFRLLTGRPYWDSLNIGQLLVDILTRPMSLPSQHDPNLPPGFDAWFLRSCHRSSQERWPSVAEQVAALDAVSHTDTGPADTQVLIAPGGPSQIRDQPSVPPPTVPAGQVPTAEQLQRTMAAPTQASSTLVSPDNLPDRGTQWLQSLSRAEAVTPTAERRQLTILSCEFVLSNELLLKTSAQQLREAKREYGRAVVEIIRSANGYTAPLQAGDSVLAYFGYPVAHGDDARRAVSTALELVEATAALRNGQNRIRLDIRIGIHTGLVLAWEQDTESAKPTNIAGATLNIASRLQTLAKPNSIVISDQTYRLIRNFFSCTGLGAQTPKGSSQHVEAYQVLSESSARSRIEGTPLERLTPMVGRDLELGILLDRWSRVEDGAGQVVLVTGEEGLGKSRLARAFKERLDPSTLMWIQSRCLPQCRDTELFPIVGLIANICRLESSDLPEEKVNKLERAMTYYSFPLAEVMPILGRLMGLSLADHYAETSMSPADQHQKVLDILLTALDDLAEKRPLVVMLMDLHWADTATLDLLNLMVHRVPVSPMMLLLTARTTFVPSWATRPHVTTVMLNRLASKRVKTMVSEITGGKDLPEEVIREIVDKTDGVPLFVDELTRMLIDSKLFKERDSYYEMVSPALPLPIPITLRDLLTEQLDRLGSAKKVAQLAAIVGREFPYELIEVVSPFDPSTLQNELDKLVEADILYQRGRIPRASYTFKHVLMQINAFESLLPSTREAYQKKIEQALAKRPELATSIRRGGTTR